jgi:energy-converting hydrogenase Eha subunit E
VCGPEFKTQCCKKKKGKKQNLSVPTCQLCLIYVHYPEAVLLISTIPFIFSDSMKLIKYYVKQNEE